jgi:hypothetical protein
MDTAVATYRISCITSDKPNDYPFTIRVERNGKLVACEGGSDWDEYGYTVSVAVATARAGMGWRVAAREQRLRENQMRWGKVG